MDKDKKELVSKTVKTVQEKVQPHLTPGKGLAVLGAGVLFYVLSSGAPVKPVVGQSEIKAQAANQADNTASKGTKQTSKESQGVLPDTSAQKSAAQAGSQTAASQQKNAAATVAGVSSLESASATATVGKGVTLSEPKKEVVKEVVPAATKSEKSEKSPVAPNIAKDKGAKSEQSVTKLLSNSVVVDDTPLKSSDNKTLDELSKWADKTDPKTAKADGAPVEEQDVIGNDAPALAEDNDNPALPPLIKEDAKTAKQGGTDKTDDADKKDVASANTPLVSPLIEPIDKNAATGLADAEPDNGSEETDKRVREQQELSQTNPFMASGEKKPAKPQTGLLSTPLPKEIEQQIISEIEASAKKRKTTGLLSAPAELGEVTIAPKAPSQQSDTDKKKQGAGTMNQAKPIKAEGHAKAHKIQKSSKSNVSEFTLSNGMNVIVIPDHRAPVVTHMVWYKVGAVDEPIGKSGIAHFLEHLMFKGTDKIASGEFSKIIARNGGQDNAFTSMDTTAYHERVAKDRLRMVMEMEADRMRNLTLSEKDVLTERDVILEERRSRTDNKPSAQFREQMESALYMNHPYGIPIIGWLHEMKQLSRKDALEFYRRFYAPNNAVLVVAGDVSVEEVEKLATEIYEPIKAEDTVIRRARAQEPPHRAPRRLTMHHKRVAKATWQRFYLAPGYSNAKPGEVEALDLLFKILGDGATGRLYKSMVVKDKIAENAGAYYSGDSLDGGKMVFYGIGAKGVKLSAVEAAVDKEIALIKEKGVTQKELDAARNAYVAAYVYANDNQVSLANRYGFAKVRGRSIAQVEGWPDMLKKVTVDDIQKVAQKYISIEKSVTGELLPEETKKAAVKAKADKG